MRTLPQQYASYQAIYKELGIEHDLGEGWHSVGSEMGVMESRQDREGEEELCKYWRVACDSITKRGCATTHRYSQSDRPEIRQIAIELGTALSVQACMKVGKVAFEIPPVQLSGNGLD